MFGFTEPIIVEILAILVLLVNVIINQRNRTKREINLKNKMVKLQNDYADLKSLNEKIIDSKKEEALVNWVNEYNDKVQNISSINDLEGETLSFLCNKLNASIGVIFKVENNLLVCKSQFATSESISKELSVEDSLHQSPVESKKMQIISDIPENYFEAFSGLGKSKPNSILIFPIVGWDKTIYTLELAFLHKIDADNLKGVNSISDTFYDKLQKLS